MPDVIYKKLINCPITRTSSAALFPYIDSEDSGWYSIYGGYHDGIDIEAKSVHSICQGVVLFIGQEYDDNNLYEISIQYDADCCLRYCHLSSVIVNKGDAVYSGSMIGEAKDFVHFEYVSIPKNNSIWPVRIGSQTYYKHNPEQYADGTLQLLDSTWTDMVIVQGDEDFEPLEFTDAMKGEFMVDNRGDHVVNV